MRPGRKALADPPTKWKVNLPSTLAAKIELLLSDSLTGKPAHGARSRLLVQLLQQWLDAREKGLDTLGDMGDDVPISTSSEDSE